MNLATVVEQHPGAAPALLDAGGTVTYEALRSRVGACRSALAARGVAPGERVVIVLPSSVDFVVAYLAALGAGAVAVPLNPQSPAPELARELATVRPALVVTEVDAEGVPAGAGAGAAAGLGFEVAGVAALERPAEAGPAPAGGAPAGAPAGAAGAGGAPAIVERDDGDPAVLLFTSGTAGFPKAAVLTHGSLRANLEQMGMRVGGTVNADDVGILLLPSSHVFGLNAVLGLHLYVGAPLVVAGRFDAQATLDLVRAHGVTVLAAVPTVFGALAALDGAGPDDLATVRLAVSGAAPLPEEVALAFKERFGMRLLQGYGLTEASPAVAFTDPGSPDHGPSSVGTPLPGVEVRIVDGDGEDVEPGDPGELLVRGPNVFAGYFEDPGATAAVVDRAGWLHTGDVAMMADDATLTLVDRRKDLVIVSGFNVYPAEVERVLGEHPLVAGVAVVGVPDPVTGETVHAFVVPAGGDGGDGVWPEGSPAPAEPTADELVRHCARHLARYKCPTRVNFVRELPRGLAGELLRRALR